MSKLLLPARKLFVIHLKSSSPHSDSDSPLKWQVQIGTSRLVYTVTWIQGHLTQVEDGTDSFLISDNTGCAKITGYSKIPQGCPQIIEGKYMMVIGELVNNDSVVVIKPMKIQDLSENPIHRKSWETEVNDCLLWTQT